MSNSSSSIDKPDWCPPDLYETLLSNKVNSLKHIWLTEQRTTLNDTLPPPGSPERPAAMEAMYANLMDTMDLDKFRTAAKQELNSINAEQQGNEVAERFRKDYRQYRHVVENTGGLVYPPTPFETYLDRHELGAWYVYCWLFPGMIGPQTRTITIDDITKYLGR